MHKPLPAPAADEPVLDRAAWATLALLCLVAVLGMLHRFMIAWFVDPIAHEMKLSDVQMGILQGMTFAIAYSLTSIAMGVAVDRFNRVRLLMLGSGLWILGSALLAIAPNYAVMLLSRLILGVGETTLTPCAASLIWDSFPKRRRGLALGLFNASAAIGVSLSAIVPSLLYDRIVGMAGNLHWSAWRLTFLAIAIVSLGLIAPLSVLREPKRYERTRTDFTAKRGSAFAQIWLFRASLFPLFLGAAFVVGTEMTLMGWLPTMLMRNFGLARSSFVGWYGATILLASTLGSVIGGFAADRVGRTGQPAHRLLPPIIATLAAIPMTLLLLIHQVGILIPALALVMTLMAVCLINILTALNTILPNELRGMATGIFSFLNVLIGLGVGQTLVPVMAKVLGSGASLSQPIVAVNTVGLVIAAIGLILAYGRARRRPVSA